MQATIYANLLTSPACQKKNAGRPGLKWRDTLHEIRSTKDYVRKNNLFMQNEPKSRKVKFNVTKVITKDYDQMDTWSIGKNEPKTNPNEPKTNPILANKMPKQTQNEPNQTQCLPAISVAGQSQYMLLIFTPLEVLATSIITSYYLEPTRPLNHRRLT